MSKTNSLSSLFELAISIEENACALYQGLEARFAYEEQVARFWHSFADEEAEHARQLREIRAALEALEPELLESPADPSILQDAYRLLTRSVEISLEKIKHLEDAYQLAHELESSETNAIFDFLVSHFARDEGTRAFLKAQLQGHIIKLEKNFPIPYRSAMKRKDVLARQPKNAQS